MTDAPMAVVCARARATRITAAYARRPATSPRGFAAARIAAFLLATLLVVLAPPLLADAPSRNVLVIYANGRLLPANFEADGGLRETIRMSSGRPVSIFDEFLDAPNFGGDAYAEIIANYLREKYASRPPDVVVAAGSEALSFLLQQRSTLFPGVPLVHLAIPVALLRSMQLPRDVVGVPVEYDFSLTVEQALRWHPQARRLVLINLILNAMDAVVGVANDHRTAVVVAVEQTTDDMVVISVRDRGPGIAVEHLPKIFDSFFSTKRDGMGLGLSIARTIVDAHGGRIVAENTARGGGLFQVELPTARRPPPTMAAPA